MNAVLERWNALDPDAAVRAILSCCGSHAWAKQLAAARPFPDLGHLLATSDVIWHSLPEAAWQEAFASHPRIGERHAAKAATPESLAWSAKEQAAVTSGISAQQALIEANQRYEGRFGHIFIVCTSGKSPSEILALLEARLHNDAAAELREAAEQQRQITQLRLRRWLGED